jgi:diamine N-acetyltransferase
MKKDVIHIVKADSTQTSIIKDLAMKTFVETYHEMSNEENLQQYLSRHFTKEKIEEELSDLTYRFFIAWIDGKPVGFAKVRKDRNPKGLSGLRCLEIERIYVLQEFQGFTVGKELMKFIKGLAMAENEQVIWLQVWQKNLKAIQFYQKSGFVVYETTFFEFGNETHQDFLLRYDLYN